MVVRVRTLRGSEEARSWQVFYMPKVLEAAGGASPDVFPRLSSPTDETLVPGRYVMWVRQPDTDRVSERTVVKVGEGKTRTAARPDRARRYQPMTPGAGAFGRDRRMWLAVAVAAAAGLAAGLAPSPPGLAAADARTTSVFAALASAAIVTLSILPFMVWRSAWRRLVWVVVAVAGPRARWRSRSRPAATPNGRARRSTRAVRS